MASVNKVILIGNLGKDPEVRYMPSGRAVANVTLATSESWTDKTTGERQERTEWHHAVFYSPLAEIAGQYLRKGSQVFVEGRLQTRKWQDKNGQDRYTTEIVASDMKMLGGRAATGAAAPFSSEGDAGPAPPSAPQPHPPPAAPRAPARSRRASPPAPAPAVAAAPDGGRWDEDDIPFVRPTALDGLPW